MDRSHTSDYAASTRSSILLHRSQSDICRNSLVTGPTERGSAIRCKTDLSNAPKILLGELNPLWSTLKWLPLGKVAGLANVNEPTLRAAQCLESNRVFWQRLRKHQAEAGRE